MSGLGAPSRGFCTASKWPHHGFGKGAERTPGLSPSFPWGPALHGVALKASPNCPEPAGVSSALASGVAEAYTYFVCKEQKRAPAKRVWMFLRFPRTKEFEVQTHEGT